MHRAVMAAVSGLALCSLHARADGPPPIAGTFFEPIPTWTGFYLGGAVGYGSASLNMTVPPDFAPAPTPNGNGWAGGIVVGYNHQIGFFVGGAELDFMAGTIETNKSFPNLIDGTTWNITTNFKTLASIRARAGVALGPVLLYGTGGGAWVSAESDIAETFAGTLLAQGVATANHLGWVAGAGVEVALSPRWIIRGEWLHYDFDNKSYHYTGQFVSTTSPAPPFTGDTSVSSPTIDVGRAAIILKF